MDACRETKNVFVSFGGSFLLSFDSVFDHLESLPAVFKARNSRTETDFSLRQHKKFNFEETKYCLRCRRCLSVNFWRISIDNFLSVWSFLHFSASSKIKRLSRDFSLCLHLIWLRLIPISSSKCLSKISGNFATMISLWVKLHVVKSWRFGMHSIRQNAF